MKLYGNGSVWGKINFSLLLCYSCFCVAPLYSPVYALSKEDTANVVTIMEKSADIKKSFSSTYDIYKNILDKFKNMMDSTLYFRIDSLGEACFNSDSTQNKMMNAFLQGYDHKKARKILQWLTTPLSTKVNEIIKRKLEKSDYEIITQQTQTAKHRTDSLLAKRFNLLTESPSFKMAVQSIVPMDDSMEKCVYLCINPVLRKQFQFSDREMSQYFMKKERLPADFILTYAVYIMLYKFRQLDDNEFAEYAKFGDSPEGTWLNKIQMESLQATMQNQIGKYKAQFKDRIDKGGK